MSNRFRSTVSRILQGFAAILVICLLLALGLYALRASLEQRWLLELVRSILSQKEFWTILGIVVGAVLGFGLNRLNLLLERSERRKIAKMQIVTNLRHWMKRVEGRLYDVRNWVASGGHGGAEHTKMPDFRFESSLEQVALLQGKTAKEIFDLIYKKDAANAEIKDSTEHDGDDDVLNAFRGRSAQIWLRALDIHDRLSQDVGWLEEFFSNEDKTMMLDEVERHRKLEEKRALYDRNLFSDIGLN